MLRLSKKMFYAVEAVMFIAWEGAGEPVSGKVIAQRQNLPPRYLEQMMQALVHAGILRGVRGPKGGYVLAREKRRIELAEICRVIRDMDPLQSEQFQQTPLSREVAWPLYSAVEAEMMKALSEHNIASLCREAEQANLPKGNAEITDFAI